MDGRTDAPRRPYRCANRTCTVESPDNGSIPKGWYGIRQYPGDRDLRPTNLGIYHSLACLIDSAQGMHEIETSEVPA